MIDFRACKIKGNSSVTFRPGATAILSNATLDSNIESKNRLKRLTLNFCRLREDKEDGDTEHFVAICSLLPGRVRLFLACRSDFPADEPYVSSMKILRHSSLLLLGKPMYLKSWVQSTSSFFSKT